MSLIESWSTRVGPKGRVVIPAAVRAAARIDIGDMLTAHAEGEGRVVIETAAAIEQRVWHGAPPSEGPRQGDVRSLRDEDTRIADAADERRSREATPTTDDVAAGDHAGTALLAELGL